MLRPHGYATVTSNDDGRLLSERDTLSCGHCNAWFAPDKNKPGTEGGFCLKCMAPTCDRCLARGTCTPFMKKLEAVEKRAVFVRSMLGG